MLNNVRTLCGGGFGKIRAAVVGDIMLDHYIYGDVNRISPEAPVPVLNVKEEKYVLGGAGNVVMNLRGLGLSVNVFGRVGNDEAGGRVADLFERSGTDASGIWTDGDTILKTRLIGGKRQQMLRIDREEILRPGCDEMNKTLKFINSSELGLVILSDYGKGTLTDEFCALVIDSCKSRNIPVFVDPKGRDWERYRGASMVTPNLRELGEVAGMKIDNCDEGVAEAGNAVRSKYGLDSLLVTRSERGATLIKDNLVHHERASAVDVYDVSGAGDTMLATVAAFIAGGADVYECVRLGNAASQIVIGKVGTYPINASELLSYIKNADNRSSDKILTTDEAVLKIASWKGKNEKVVFTNGCFDVFHAGHLDSLTRAKNLGNRLIVGLNSDNSVRRLKGSSRPINDENARARVLEALSVVDCVVIFDEETPEKLLSFLTPDVIAKGGDYTPEQVAGGQYAKEVVILPILEGYSTTGILRRLGND